MNFSINKTEKDHLTEIESKYYMKPVIKKINDIFSQENDKVKGWEKIFDKLYDLMINSKVDVDKLLVKRKKSGEINNIEQARKSIAGAVFSNLLIYTFINNKIVGNISNDIYITSKYKSLKGFEKISTIYVDEETQKPDCDLVNI